MEDTNHVNRIGNPVMRKLLVIGLLVLVLLLPTAMIMLLIEERSAGKQGAINEVGRMWGGEQTITGPILSVPYRAVVKNEKGDRMQTVQYAHFLPEQLNIHGTVNPQVRHRGIYEMILYNSDLHISAVFGEMNFSELGVSESQILWDKAFVSLRIDPRGLKSGGDIIWNNSKYAMNSGIPSSPSTETGIMANIPVSERHHRNTLTMDLSLNGCGQISFFRLAYLISSMAVTALIVFYSGSIMGKRMSVTVGGLLVSLYCFLYVMLQLEDYALLMGSIGLFAILGAIMYLTRKIDWYAVNPMKPQEP
jgi:inner membrane protein involved in colicin E2 resistance